MIFQAAAPAEIPGIIAGESAAGAGLTFQLSSPAPASAPEAVLPPPTPAPVASIQAIVPVVATPPVTPDAVILPARTEAPAEAPAIIFPAASEVVASALAAVPSMGQVVIPGLPASDKDASIVPSGIVKTLAPFAVGFLAFKMFPKTTFLALGLGYLAFRQKIATILKDGQPLTLANLMKP